MMKNKILALALAGVTGFGTMGATLAPAQAISSVPTALTSTRTPIIQVQYTREGSSGSHTFKIGPNNLSGERPRGGYDQPRQERRSENDRPTRSDRERWDRHDYRGAQADRRYYDNRRNYNRNPHWRGERRYYQGRYWRPANDGWYVYNDGAWIAAGALGLAAGAILGSAMTQPPQSRGTIQSGAPVTANGIPPWTPAWYQYCSGKYKSFNAQTGLYLGYDGKYHYCR